MTDKHAQKSVSFSKRSIKTQGSSVLDILVIIVVILTVFGFMLTMVFGDGSDSGASTAGTARSATNSTVSSTNTYPYTQPATTYAQPTYSQPTYGQSPYQGRAGFNSVSSDINATDVVVSGVGTGAVAGSVASSQPVAQTTSQTQAYNASGELINLNPIQPLATPFIPTTAPTAVVTGPIVTGRAAITLGSNPAAPYNPQSGNAAIYIDSVQAYRPQNQELIMDQACVNEVWQRNPYVIRNFSNLSVRLSATNPAANGNMRTYSFNLDNRPTGNGALCTVTNDGYVTAVSFY